MAKKKNPADATLRNVRASAKRDSALQQAVSRAHGLISHLRADIIDLRARVKELESPKFRPYARTAKA